MNIEHLWEDGLVPYRTLIFICSFIPQHTYIHRVPPLHLYLQLRWEQG